MRLEIPAPLLDCLPDPEPPAGDSQDAAALYLITLWTAGDDCRSKLLAVRALVK